PVRAGLAWCAQRDDHVAGHARLAEVDVRGESRRAQVTEGQLERELRAGAVLRERPGEGASGTRHLDDLLRKLLAGSEPRTQREGRGSRRAAREPGSEEYGSSS